ncbi:hypothetical protein [Stutzerimonas stutzeri]|uniref:hypothetical protein n=1 Tax=Stutzerimonas stutzeri TaxID=316 RepID=UPI0015E2CF6E|nr:hypothetical protein [Stutzerimonas stutzeri]MBA1278133.1 hypothetical protein [Stutzerimonas stutzeri]
MSLLRGSAKNEGPFAARGRQLIAIGEALCDPKTTVADLVRIASECGLRVDFNIASVISSGEVSRHG